jgi:hypothetical protein
MNQYPPHSLLQCLDRLPARARAKYDDLQAAVADSEALQRSLMERIKAKEDRLNDVARRRDYAAGDAAEVARLDAELAVARADLGKLEVERSKRNSVRSNVEQTVSRLNNFIGELFSGASDITRPPWPDVVPRPAEGESLTDSILRLRREISIAQGELQCLRAAPPPAAEIKATIEAEVDRLAAAGAPQIAIEAGRVVVHWPDVLRFAVPGQALSAPSGSASQLLCALFPAQLKKLLTAGIVDTSGSVSSRERPRLIRAADAHVLALEIAEERLVVAALDAGLECHRRIDASPWAILFADMETVQAVAAE